MEHGGDAKQELSHTESPESRNRTATTGYLTDIRRTPSPPIFLTVEGALVPAAENATGDATTASSVHIALKSAT